MKTRDEHLAWCKERALQLVDQGKLIEALSSMSSDLTKWEGGEMYRPGTIETLALMGAYDVTRGPAAVRRFIEGYN